MMRTTDVQAEDVPPEVHPASFDELYRREYPTMVRIATLVGGSLTVAEEVVQDAFVRVHERFDRLDNPGAYLRSCVVNGCRDGVRRRGRLEQRLPVLAAMAPRSLEHDGAADARLEVARALDRLSTRSRLAIVLKFYGGWTVPEIADALGLPAGTVKTVIHRGLAQMRKEVEP